MTKIRKGTFPGAKSFVKGSRFVAPPVPHATSAANNIGIRISSLGFPSDFWFRISDFSTRVSDSRLLQTLSSPAECQHGPIRIAA
jgi:hypothetical protein